MDQAQQQSQETFFIFTVVTPKAKAGPQYYEPFGSAGCFMNL